MRNLFFTLSLTREVTVLIWHTWIKGWDASRGAPGSNQLYPGWKKQYIGTSITHLWVIDIF